MAAIIEVKYFNSFLLRKSIPSTGTPTWNGSTGIPVALGGYPRNNTPSVSVPSWVVEEARIRGGYNNTNVDYGVKAYLVEDEPNAVNRGNSLIYSGIFNSRTGINDTNVFSIGSEITKSADPANGTIQKLYAEDTNLIIFQESKVSRALIDKDAIYTAEGGGSITNVNTTIGTIQPYGGNFGISRDPGSFAAYGYRKYFTDKDRNAVLRLSMDGLTEISTYGMYDYFRDEFTRIDTSSSEGDVIGGWDIHNKQYVLSTHPVEGSLSNGHKTLTYDEDVKGWTSFFSYKPDQSFSLRSDFYTLNNGQLWRHYSPNVNRGSFYGVDNNTSITFVFNPKISMSKVFNTVNYEGSNGWQVSSFVSDQTGADLSVGNWSSISDTADPTQKPAVYSYYEGAYTENGVTYYMGFDRKENKYQANLVNYSVARQGEIVFGSSMTGIKGYFSTVTVSTDGFTATTSQAVTNSVTIPLSNINGVLEINKTVTGQGVTAGTFIESITGNSVNVNTPQTISNNISLIIGGTNPGGAKELFAVSSNYSESSY